MQNSVRSLDDFFGANTEARRLFDVLQGRIKAIGFSEISITTSQIAFRRKKAFAWAWLPGRYLNGKTAALVLSLSLKERDSSPRWKEIVEPARGRFMHHLEINTAADIDVEVGGWLRAAWSLAE